MSENKGTNNPPPEAYFKELKNLTHELDVQKRERNMAKSVYFIGGSASEEKIEIPSLPPEAFIANYLHEVGHIVGNNYSFLDGSVLTPDECKTKELEIPKPLMDKLFRLLVNYDRDLLANQDLKPLVEVCNIALKAFTKDKFDPNKYKVETNVKMGKSKTSEPQIVRIIKSEDVTSDMTPTEMTDIYVDQNSNLFLVCVNSKEGRNEELNAYAVQLGCIQMVEKTVRAKTPLKKYVFRYPELEVDTDESHNRAFKIAKRAYSKSQSGWKLPSTYDNRK